MTPARPGTVLSSGIHNFSVPRASEASASALPCEPRTALAFLALAAAEEAERHRRLAASWSARMLPDASATANAWAAYQRRLESQLQQENIEMAAVLDLAAQAPEGGGDLVGELRSVLDETDSELFSQALLGLAQRHLHHDRAPSFSRELLRFAQAHPSTRIRAERELDLLNGGGGFASQLEYQAPRLLRDLTSPLMLGSFGTAILAARAASVAVLARSARLGWGSLLASEGAALAVEVPALVFSRRLGAQLFFGAEGVFSGAGLANELLAGYTSFGLLRAFGNALQLGAPRLRSLAGLNDASGALSPFGRFTFESLRLSGEVSAVAAGHSLNVALGLEPLPASGAQPWLQSLLTVGHMRLAGHLLHRLGFNPLHGEVEAQRRALIWGRRQSFEDPGPRPGGGFGWVPELAFAKIGRVPRHRDPRLDHVSFMSADNPQGGGRRSGDGGSEPPPTRRDVVLELLQQNLTEYTQKAETRDTVLGKAAKRLQDLLEKIERPDLEHDEAFLRSLEEVEIELKAAQEHGSTLRRSVETLKVLFRRSAASGHSALQPEVAEQKSAQLEADEAQRSAFANSLGKMQEVLRKARDIGWSEELYGQLDRARTALNELYGKTVYRIPGLNRVLRRGSSAEEILQRRYGAALGMVLVGESGFSESPVVRRLRNALPEPGTQHDIELELLQESILLATRKTWNPHDLQAALQGMAEVYRASEETRAAMVLNAQAVNALVQHGQRAPDLLELIQTMPDSLVLHDRLISVEALRDPQSDFRVGLEQLGAQAVAADYLSSGLLVFLRSGGDGARLLELLNTAREARVPGYHPSIPVSLFGAAYGRKSIPSSLLPTDGQAEAFLIRAFPPETR